MSSEAEKEDLEKKDQKQEEEENTEQDHHIPVPPKKKQHRRKHWEHLPGSKKKPIRSYKSPGRK
jgi:hypothetical protein